MSFVEREREREKERDFGSTEQRVIISKAS